VGTALRKKTPQAKNQREENYVPFEKQGSASWQAGEEKNS
jgi:hypothetical protein